MSKDKLAQVFHFDLYGKREDKYDFLNDSSIESIEWKELDLDEPNYFFVEKDFDEIVEYEKGFIISDLFLLKGMGITTGNDNKLIAFERNDLCGIYDNDDKIRSIAYRTFDNRFIYYDNVEVERAREGLMKNLINESNLGLVCLKSVRNNLTSKIGIVTKIVDKSIISTLDNGYVFPLYLYQETNNQLSIGESQTRTPNLNAEIVHKIASGLGLKFVAERNASTPPIITNGKSDNVSLSGVEDHVSLNKVAESSSPYQNASQVPSPSERLGEVAPIDLLDYIYAVLHSPAYREKYKEFLKIDFPRVPYPTDPKQFYDLVDLGSQLRELHLLESPETENYITQYPIDGDNVVEKLRFVSTVITNGSEAISNKQTTSLLAVTGRVYINDTQYFADVPLSAWGFYIGGYQPAQKWLKDRKGRALSFEDIMHYQRIIVALKRTSELMKEIDEVLEV